MNIFARYVRRFAYCAPFGDDSGGGGGGGEIAAPAAPAPVAAPAEAPAPSAAPAAPTSMFEAISQGLDQNNGQPRDEQGRWAPKANTLQQGGTVPAAPAQTAAPAVPAAPAVAPIVPAAEEDLTAMPEGLQPKAQERFQKLANTNKEMAAQLEQVLPQFEAFQTVLSENAVKRDQFEAAVSVIGMMNRGDLEGAEKVLLQQLQQIAIMTGRQPGAVDALADFPDLRQQVDGLMMTEQSALEVARARIATQAHQAQQQGQQRQQQEQRAQQEAKQAQQQQVQQGTLAVDRFCKAMASSDMDYAAIEAQLLPVLPQLLQHVPPNLWENTVRTQYDLIKKVAGSTRTSSAPAGSILRPTGQASPAAAPRTMAEAMWGKPLSA